MPRRQWFVPAARTLTKPQKISHDDWVDVEATKSLACFRIPQQSVWGYTLLSSTLREVGLPLPRPSGGIKENKWAVVSLSSSLNSYWWNLLSLDPMRLKHLWSPFEPNLSSFAIITSESWDWVQVNAQCLAWHHAAEVSSPDISTHFLSCDVMPWLSTNVLQTEHITCAQVHKQRSFSLKRCYVHGKLWTATPNPWHACWHKFYSDVFYLSFPRCLETHGYWLKGRVSEQGSWTWNRAGWHRGACRERHKQLRHLCILLYFSTWSDWWHCLDKFLGNSSGCYSECSCCNQIS